MPNIHTPARQSGETREQYQARRAASKAALRRETRPPMQTPAVSALFLGQHTNPTRNAQRRARRAAK